MSYVGGTKMGKVKYFKSLPDQLYIYKRFDSVGKMEGCECDECSAWLQNIVTVVGSVDHITYHLGLTCCEKASKGMKDISLDDKTAQAVKYWKKRINRLKAFHKKFLSFYNNSNNIAVLGDFHYNAQKRTCSVDFTFLEDNGDWWCMHENFCISGFYNRVKEEFKDVWDRIDWAWYKPCADANDSKEVWEWLHNKSNESSFMDLNKRTETYYPEWSRKSDVRCAIRQSFDYNTGWGEGKTVKLPRWFNKDEYEDIFDEVLNTYGGYKDLEKTNFVNNYHPED